MIRREITFMLALLAGLMCPLSRDSAQAGSLPKERLIPPLGFVIPSPAFDQQRYEAGMMIAKEWEKMGVKVDVRQVPNYPAFTKAADDPWDHAAFITAYLATPERIEPSLLLSTPFLSSLIGRGKSNLAGYNSPEFDRTMALSEAELDLNKRRILIFRAQEILARDLPHITLYHRRYPSAYNKDRFAETVLSASTGYLNFWNFLRATPLAAPSTLRVGWVGGDVPTLNPVAPVYNLPALQVIQMMYDTLARISPDGSVVPWAAEKWTALNPTTVEVVLRRGMTFHDGRPVTARDVAFAYRFFMHWKPSYYATALNPLESVTAHDDRTVQFKTKRPYAPLVVLTLTQIPIVPQHVWDGVVERERVPSPDRWPAPNLVGSGPWRFVSLKPAQEVRLTRYNNHFSPPKAQDWLMILYANQETAFVALLQKDVDFYPGLTAVQYEEAKRASFLDFVEAPDIGVFYLQFNLRPNSPFHDYAFREAFAHLIDYKAIVSMILRGLGEPGRGVIAPANKFWHNATIPSREVEGKPHYHQFDPERARALLRRAGYEWGDDGRLHVPKNFKPQPYPQTTR